MATESSPNEEPEEIGPGIYGETGKVEGIEEARDIDLERVAERARTKSKPEPMPEESRPTEEAQKGEAVMWGANPAQRLVQIKPLDGRAPIFLGFDAIKIIAATVLSMEAQAEQHGVPFPRFDVSNPETLMGAPGMPPGVGPLGRPGPARVNPFDGNGIKAR